MKVMLITCLLMAGCNLELPNSKSKKKITKTSSAKPQTPEQKPPSTPDIKPPSNLPLCKSFCKKWSPSIDTSYSSMGFANFGYRGIGRCRGHAIVTQKLSQLLLYKKMYECPYEKEKCETENLNTLSNALNNYQVGIIYGRNNLLELSSDMSFQPYLKAVVRGTSNWFSSGLSNIFTKEYDHFNLNLFHDIVRRLNNKSRPYLGVLGTQRISSHALLAYDYEYTNGIDKICIEDSNVIADWSGGLDCQNYLYFNHVNKSIYYFKSGWHEKLALVNLYEDDDERNNNYKSAWKSYCSEKLKNIRCI